MIERHAALHRFVKLLIARRLRRDVEHERQRVSLNQFIRSAHKTWHGAKAGQPDWSDWSHSLALMVSVQRQNFTFYLIVNAYWESLDFELPLPGGADSWRRWIDTSLDSPNDIVELEAASLISGHSYRTGPRSVVVLFANVASVF